MSNTLNDIKYIERKNPFLISRDINFEKNFKFLIKKFSLIKYLYKNIYLSIDILKFDDIDCFLFTR